MEEQNAGFCNQQQQVVCACTWSSAAGSLGEQAWPRWAESRQYSLLLWCHQAGHCLLFTHPTSSMFASVLNCLRINLFGDLSGRSVPIMVVFVLYLLPAKRGMNSNEVNRNNGFCRLSSERLLNKMALRGSRGKFRLRVSLAVWENRLLQLVLMNYNKHRTISP